MHIQVTDKLAIGADEYQWKLMEPMKRKDKKTGREFVKWEGFRFFATFEQLAQEAVELSVRRSNAKSIPELRVELENASTALSTALRGNSDILVNLLHVRNGGVERA